MLPVVQMKSNKHSLEFKKKKIADLRVNWTTYQAVIAKQVLYQINTVTFGTRGQITLYWCNIVYKASTPLLVIRTVD